MINYTAARKYVTPQNAPLILKEAKSMRSHLYDGFCFLCIMADDLGYFWIYALLRTMFKNDSFLPDSLFDDFKSIDSTIDEIGFHGSRHNLLEAIITELEIYIKNNKA